MNDANLMLRFYAFHNRNPHVCDRLVALARDYRKRHPNGRLGIGLLFEVLRWERLMQTTGDDFKLNNDFRAPYSRIIMRTRPDLAGVFEVRRSDADDSMGDSA